MAAVDISELADYEKCSEHTVMTRFDKNGSGKSVEPIIEFKRLSLDDDDSEVERMDRDAGVIKALFAGLGSNITENTSTELLNQGDTLANIILAGGGKISSGQKKRKDVNEDLNNWHGYKRNEDYEVPKCISKCDEQNRPGYHSVKSHEYKDTPDVLDKKLDQVAAMLKASKATVIYSGAGLSTATGMYDYASKRNKDSVIHKLGSTRDSVAGKSNGANRLSLQPTLGHHALTALAHKGFAHHWLQQNHDRLAQKAGYPQEKINEIHGAWGDAKNPVVAMSGSLRSDLMDWLLEWEDKVEVCLTVGTSLCGMRADSITTDCATRAMDYPEKYPNGGLIVIGLQATPEDENCAVRIWGLLDDVLVKLAKKCGIAKVPDPALKTRGATWQAKHPNCIYHTPIRKKPVVVSKPTQK